MVSFHETRDSSEGPDFGQTELSVEYVEYEVPLDFWILEIGLETRTGRGLPAWGVQGY